VDRGQNMMHALCAQDVNGSGISFPVGCGAAGTVAATGEILDIPNAYEDRRFNKRFDARFGYHTNDLFTMPVSNRRGEIVGVLQLLNRLRPITDVDREFLLGISVFIGLALENAWFHSQLLAKEQLEHDFASLRDRLADTERISLVSEMFGGIVHEINNPLTFAMGFAELARDQEGLPDHVRAYLEKVMLGIDQTALAARRFQEFVERQTAERTQLNLAHALRQMTDLRSHEWARNDIQTALILESVPPVLAHESQMQLVLLYLIKNAEDALLRSEKDRQLRIHLSGAADQVRVEIYDSGPSVDPDMKPRLFQPFFTTKSKGAGAGLGLAMAASIVQQHHGNIRVESESGRGATFILELPAAI